MENGPLSLPSRSKHAYFSTLFNQTLFLIPTSFLQSWLEQLSHHWTIYGGYELRKIHVNLMLVDPCIIAHFIKKKNPTRCNNISKFYYSIFIWSSTCFGRHTAHHQEPKTALAASCFSYVEGCWTCSWWTLSGTVCLTTSTNYTSKQPSTYEKPEAASAVLGSWWWTVCRPKHIELHINME